MSAVADNLLNPFLTGCRLILGFSLPLMFALLRVCSFTCSLLLLSCFPFCFSTIDSHLKRAALNFRPFVTQSFTWVLPGVLTAFCPKRKIAPRNLAMGDFNLPPIAAYGSRHNLRLRTTLSREAARRVRLWALAHRETPGRVCLLVVGCFLGKKIL